MSGDQNLSDKLRLYPASADMCRWQAGDAESLDFVGVRDKAANTRGTEAKNKERGLGGKGYGSCAD